ncbi:XAC2610-related protein [Pseudomonas sp. PDM18]|uniref:XAC2610-related protein n=1 Tax=Pseudomonas sp. PDM18 TaxID=2769253 RepID=UPI00399AED53
MDFFPEGRSKYTITTEGSSIIITGDNEEKETINIDTESKLNIEIADYNFDGNLDFSVWHMDEGMGTYLIYRVFIFKPKIKKFTEANPNCGDEFINLNLDRKSKTVSSTYFKNNTPRVCHTRL